MSNFELENQTEMLLEEIVNRELEECRQIYGVLRIPAVERIRILYTIILMLGMGVGILLLFLLEGNFIPSVCEILICCFIYITALRINSVKEFVMKEARERPNTKIKDIVKELYEGANRR